MHIFTPEDLVQYLYNETSRKKSAAIEAALEANWRLKEIFDVIVTAHKRLEAFEISPRKKVISEILAHAKKRMNELHTR
ncbi:MAG: hypothetical protein H0W12_06590 [Chitinophagaceae bacterium]|nr:hypothetical protein [Chitinophagaceae bacterium]